MNAVHADERRFMIVAYRRSSAFIGGFFQVL
jgi:hypothetical protein